MPKHITPNDFRIDGNTAYLIATSDKGKKFKGEIVIDAADIELARSFRWCIDSAGYAIRATANPPPRLRLHELLLGKVKGECGDHINGNRLDNRRQNLRRASFSMNTRNRLKSKNTLFYRGRWYVEFMIDYTPHHYGPFADEVEASHAAGEYREKLLRGESLPPPVWECARRQRYQRKTA